MQSLFSLKASRVGWLLGLLLLALGWLLPQTAQATHFRAGDIQAKVDTTAARNPRRIFFKLTIYRDPTTAQLGPVTIYYGDGSNSGVDSPGGIPKATEVVSVPGFVNVATYLFEHTYAGSSIYRVSMVESNRVADIRNIPGSVNQNFYLETNITVDPGIGPNRLPVLRGPAIDQAVVGQVFKHSPAAYDADKDSLSYHLVNCQQVIGIPNQPSTTYNPTPVSCTGYVLPNDPSIGVNGPPLTVPYTGTADSPSSPGSLPAVFSQDVRTGLITWNAPRIAGTYSIAYVVEEWRRTPLGFFLRGSVLRDMQIRVVASQNIGPVVTIPTDTCIVAGAQLVKRVVGVDIAGAGAPATTVQLFAYSGILPPATFRQTVKGTRSVGTFTWTPQCEDVAKEPYIIAFKAQDTPTPAGLNNPALVDIKTWRVTVVAPAPTNLLGTITNGNRVQLAWDRYYCQTTNVTGVKPVVLIFRRENCFAYTPSACQTGLPAGSGYVQIGSVPSDVFSFIDDNGGAGLPRGKTYSYRIYVTFPFSNGQPGDVASLASNEACVGLNGRSAQLTNVDVLTTSATAGQIAVKWTQPRPNVGSFNAPLGYRLSRSSNGVAPFTLLTTKTSLADTTYVDAAPGLNTQDVQYTYQLVFFSATTTQPGSGETVETAATASSVRTAVVPNSLGSLNTITWTYNVPWTNAARPTNIYRRIGGTGPYTLLTTVTPGATSGTYTDRGLTNGTNYCYYVQTNGQYPTPVNSAGQPIYTNLLNRSQEQCAVLNSTPCTPVLTLSPTNCDSLAALPSFPSEGQRYQNRLRWTIGNTPTGCSSDVAYFRIYYRSTAEGALVLLDSTTQYTYLHRQLVNPAGCYVVQAVSPARVRGAQSNVACQDNCAFFLLPNIFTPNGDAYNATFRPKTASPVLRTHIQIFNRWGRKVYESDKDPYINWDGGGAANEVGTSGKVADGLYYYVADVEFADFAATKRTFKGWVEVLR